jgi:DNA-binding transcriptional LysR family regulator
MITQIRSFLAVIEEGSLNRAADRLRMSQPALTRKMQVLEREMGGGLLDRSSFGVRSTDAGYELASRMRPILVG